MTAARPSARPFDTSVPGRPIASTPARTTPLSLRAADGPVLSMRIFFFGGARTVTGSMHSGRIVHHLRNNIEDERNTVLIVGFQARNTLGRQLVEHRPEVRIFGIDVPVEAEIVDVGAFSSHADANELAGFAETCRSTLEHVFLVHGEEPQVQVLAARLRAAGIGPVTVPQAGTFHDIHLQDVADRRVSA